MSSLLSVMVFFRYLKEEGKENNKMDYLVKFEEYLYYQKHASSNTLQSYLRDVRSFLSYWNDKSDNSPIKEVTAVTLKRYLAHLEEEGKSRSTLMRVLASLRCYFQFLTSEEAVCSDPTKEIHLDRDERKLPMILSEEEISLLLAQPEEEDLKGCRDKAMLELLYATGIRVSELVDLNVEDINLRQSLLLCRNGKSERSIPIYYEAVRAISNYMIKVRNGMQLHSDSGHALFLNLNGRRLTRQGFRKIVKEYAQKANIQKEITPHTLRHSFAIHLLQNGAQLRDIQEMLGHADISTTHLYSRMMDGHCQQVYQECHPRAKAR